MKNILNEIPKHYDDLSGRCRFCCDWLSAENITRKKVLEIGCGIGWFALNSAEKNVGHYVGIEHQRKNLYAAENNIFGFLATEADRNGSWECMCRNDIWFCSYIVQIN